LEIVNKFVSNITDSENTKLDDHISVDGAGTFLKIDVEGAESKLLNGCKRIFSEQKPLKVAICTYHKQNNEKDFTELLSQKGFKCSSSNGYMLFCYDKQIKAPYLRRGLIRAQKN